MDLQLPYSEALQTRLMNYAIRRFNREDKYLLQNSLNERCMCARLAMYLDERIRELRLGPFYADVEYNRGYDGLDGNVKRIDGGCVSLDLIVHKRGHDSGGEGFCNIICVEMKKESNSEKWYEDEDRLRKLTDPTYGFGYRVGYMLVADDVCEEKLQKLRIQSIFRNGQKQP